MRKIVCVIVLLVYYNLTVFAQTKRDISIIPKPNSIEEMGGDFTINHNTEIFIEPDILALENLAGMLSEQINAVTGFNPTITSKKNSNNTINLRIKPKDTLSKEAYLLSVTPEEIDIEASKKNGLFYGIVTLGQLLPSSTINSKENSNVIIPGIKIIDEPRFSWRGMMLDVGRYFYPVSFIKKFIDYLAMHKMNTFHWHLTEDHGWRIEIEKYPKLTEVGAWRSATQITPGGRIDENIHGGFYTKEQIREVVEYAKDRYITVIPEIELPGHALASIVAYPELSCIEGPFEIPVHWAIQENIYCAGNERTFEFLENVLSEVVELFPSPIIHIGGDEAPKKHWKQCLKCQKRIEQEGLADEHELQSYFINRIGKFLLTKNKNIVGWDEILEGGLPANATVMSWRGIQGGIAAAKQNHDVIMTPTSYMYFDYYQGDPTLEPVAISHGPVVTMQRVYSYEPVPQELSPSQTKYIKGVQGNIWSEFIHSPEKVEYMGFPRGAALAEVAWTEPRNKDWEDFKVRMETQYQRYESKEMNYARSAYNVWQNVEVDSDKETAKVTFQTDSYDPEIYYSLDGSQPSNEKYKYSGSFFIENATMIKAATFKNGVQVSRISTKYINESLLRDGDN